MSGNEHHATVDKGLKMKIKRKNVNSKSDAKHEIVKAGEKMSSISNDSSSNGTQAEKSKQSTSGEKSPKVKGSHKKEKSKERLGKGSADVSSVSTTLDAAFSQVSLESKPADSSKADDPYDFCEAKDDESIGFTLKKVKSEKNESTSFQNHVGTDTCTIGVATDPDCLGPCEPGTNVLLEGIVWQETENGVLVVNVTWRDKTYVGTLLDATKHEWAPPRFNCDSPVSDLDSRTPKGRSKRGRNSNSTPIIDKALEGRTLRKGRKGSTFTAPPSPAKSDISVSSVGLKRKGRPVEVENVVNDNAKVKRSRSCSRGAAGDGSESPVPNFIECPEPNCKKKYRHMNGLRYHQSHAHSSQGFDNDEESRDVDNADDSMLDEMDTTTMESCENSSNNLKIDMDSIESENKKDNEDSVNIDIVNVVKPTVKPTAEVSKMETGDSSKKDTSANVTKPIIGAGHSFHAVIAGTKGQSSEVSSMSSPSTTIIQSQTVNPTIVSVPPISSSPLQSTRPITFAAITAGSQSNDLSSGKTEKLIKPKVINRPIAPSNMIALNTNVTVTHTNLAPVTTHVSSTTQFQPIQPKPTVLGENSAVNQHLLNEFKEKKKHKRKSKDKESNSGSNTTQSVNIAAPKLLKPDVKKTEPSSVIKVAPMISKPPEQIKKEVPPLNRSAELDKEKPSVTSEKPSYPPVGIITGQVQPQTKVVDLSHTPRSEASVLKVTPTLQVVTNECNKSNINDDVQSPAYSDISDANDAGSPAQSASPQIIDDKFVKTKDTQGALPPNAMGLENPQMNKYGLSVYGNCYNPSPYLLSPAAQGSPGSNIQKMQQSSNMPVNKDQNVFLDQLKSGAESKSKVEESKDENNKNVGEKGDKPQQLSQTEIQQLQHQQWVNQQMFALQSLPPQQQYHYMAAYGPYFNRDYHMQMMASDPMYRQHFEKIVEDQQKRMHPDGIPKELESPRSVSRSSSTDISVVSGPQSDGNKNKPQNLSIDYAGMYHNRESEKRSFESEKDQKDKALREKQPTEIRPPNAKDGFEMKSMDKIRPDAKVSEEQAKRMQMYKEQKSMEQQKRVEMKKTGSFDSHALPVDLVNSKAGNSGPFSSDKPKDSGSMPVINIKQEPCNKLKDANRSDSLPDINKSANSEKATTPSIDKVKMEERSNDKTDKLKNYDSSLDRPRNSSTPVDKSRSGSVETPKSKLGQYSKPSSPHTPSSSVPQPVSSGAHYSPYLYHSQFVQSPPHGHPFDYRNIVQNVYSPSNYIHPSQLGYPVGGSENEKQKVASGSKPGVNEGDLKKSEPFIQGNSSAGHKIHELQEKGKPGSRSASPVTSKNDKTVIGRDASSPPTQRHVHTHHHTHVLEAAYPVYHYPSIYPSQTQVPQGAPIQHQPYPPP